MHREPTCAYRTKYGSVKCYCVTPTFAVYVYAFAGDENLSHVCRKMYQPSPSPTSHGWPVSPIAASTTPGPAHGNGSFWGATKRSGGRHLRTNTVLRCLSSTIRQLNVVGYNNESGQELQASEHVKKPFCCMVPNGSSNNWRPCNPSTHDPLARFGVSDCG